LNSTTEAPPLSADNAGYLRLDRGVRPTQRVFLRVNAPRMPLSGPASIGHIVRHAMAQAAVERPKQIAAHLFRHTLASRMLQQGANWAAANRATAPAIKSERPQAA
jgi:site-specific recombinase XerD